MIIDRSKSSVNVRNAGHFKFKYYVFVFIILYCCPCLCIASTSIDKRKGVKVEKEDTRDWFIRRIRHDTIVRSSNLITISPDGNDEIDDDDDDDYDYVQYENNHSLVTRQLNITDQNANICISFPYRRILNSNPENIRIMVTHPIFDLTKGINPGIVYQVSMNMTTKRIKNAFIETENENGEPIGKFHPARRKNCSNLIQLNKVELSNGYFLLNWTCSINLSTFNESTVIFKFTYELSDRDYEVYLLEQHFPLLKGCDFYIISSKEGYVSSSDIDTNNTISNNCRLIFSDIFPLKNITSSIDRRKQGLMITVKKLNIKCDLGYVKFSWKNNSGKLCGKLEEIPLSEREYYFPPTELQPILFITGKAIFSIFYKLVDFCYNVTMTSSNDSIVIQPLLKIYCNFKIALPYGYRASITITLNSKDIQSNDRNTEMAVLNQPLKNSCDGLLIQFFDGNISKSYCPSNISQYIHFESKENIVRISIKQDGNATNSSFTIKYEAIAISNITGDCPFGSIRMRDVCVTVIDNFKLNWTSAELECVKRNGHLASIPDENTQHVINTLLTKSPGYGNQKSYWIGASDIGYEGEFRWTDSLPFAYTNWFSGWTQYGYYNRQPNDDGFSDQDCVELRRQYHLSATATADADHGALRLTPTFTWNDRDCSTRNYFICEILQSNPGSKDQTQPEYVETTLGRWLGQKMVFVGAGYAFHAGTPIKEIMIPFFLFDPAHLTLPPIWETFKPDLNEEVVNASEHLSPSGGGKEERDVVVKGWKEDCNQNVALTQENNRAVISSPGFPHKYPDNKECYIQLNAPPSYNIFLVFEEFVLEEEPSCSYDYLEIYEESIYNDTYFNKTFSKRYCGDWSDKLKLLRYISTSSAVLLHFVSDYSHQFSGYKARVYIEHVKTGCADNRLQIYNNSCYLFVSFPQVTWQTAHDICAGIQGDLASIRTLEEEHFIVAKIRESHEYTTSTIYWLGAYFDPLTNTWKWIDNSDASSDWLSPVSFKIGTSKNVNVSCLGIQWIPSPSAALPSGLYRLPVPCHQIGGYVCKLKNQSSKEELNLNVTLNGLQGTITSPNFPGNYYNNLDYWVRIIGPESTRIIIQFDAFDLEEQTDCLYDFLEISNASTTSSDFVRRCGHHHQHQLHWLNFVSVNNEAHLRFRTDYSVTGSGFSAMWKAVDISGCPGQSLTAKEGIITSPNYPNFLLANLHCSTTIFAPVGRHVWFEILDWDLGKEENMENNLIPESDLFLQLGSTAKIYPYREAKVLSDGAYVSYGENIKIHLKTSDSPLGRGFKGIYKTVSVLQEERTILLSNSSRGNLYHLNYPLWPVGNIHYTQRFIAPLGYSVHLQFHQVVPSILDRDKSTTVCPGENVGFIEIRDSYAEQNGTWWQLCEAIHGDASYLTITSYLNTLAVSQISKNNLKGIHLNVSLIVLKDLSITSKIMEFPAEYSVESCSPNPCINGGKCISIGKQNICQCRGHFTGLFCALTLCDKNPCVFGNCNLMPDKFICECHAGYEGIKCDRKIQPCASEPCGNRGICSESSDTTFKCQCHAWWEGERCDRKIQNIPYRPLHERMLDEPFWIGLLAVCGILSAIGLFFCLRKHFPDKLHKLIAEEEDRSRFYAPSTSRNYVLRGEYISQNGTAPAVALSQTNTAASSPTSRTFFGRLGIRKSSMFSLSSPLGPTRNDTSRTCSLDDIFKSSSRTPMSNKHRNKAEKKKRTSSERQILERLIPSNMEEGKNEEIESIELTATPKNKSDRKSKSVEETSFTIAKIEYPSLPEVKSEISKYEKKVTFARLLNKVQSEINNEIQINKDKEDEEEKEKEATQCLNLNNQGKSLHHITSCYSNNEGSDSPSSCETSFISASGELSTSGIRPNSLGLQVHGKHQKAASADSLFSVFRKLSSSNNNSNNAAECSFNNFVSNSNSPTISSPQELGSDDSSLSSYQYSLSSGVMDSPPCTRLHQTTLQVPAIDSASQPKNSSSNNLLCPPTTMIDGSNKCLSPIREVPTPSPSPALTPIMSRHYTPPTFTSSSSQMNQENKGLSRCLGLSPNVVAAQSTLVTSIAVPISVAKPSYPSTLSEGYQNTKDIPTIKCSQVEDDNNGQSVLVIPTLTIQEPSPINEIPPIVVCPGTPPEQHKKEKSMSLDFTSSPPMITVTCMSEADSDTDSHAVAAIATSTSGSSMCYLSPFSMCTRNDRISSESNLSSSGYSSMASPAPSRCGSNNPLCPSESEEQSHNSPKKPSPILRLPSNSDKTDHVNIILRSDSETLSDDHQIESNDEGFGTDHNIEDKKEDKVINDRDVNKTQQLVLPSIVVDPELSPCENRSPVSSRSESPLSDRTGGLGRFSPMFYGKLTDSDGLYDCTSSECLKATHRKHIGRRRERRRSKSPKVLQSTAPQVHLDIPTIQDRIFRKPSPRRRVRSHQTIRESSSSSSSETLSHSRAQVRRHCTRLATGYSSRSTLYSTEASAEDTNEEQEMESEFSPKNDIQTSEITDNRSYSNPQRLRSIFTDRSSKASDTDDATTTSQANSSKSGRSERRGKLTTARKTQRGQSE